MCVECYRHVCPLIYPQMFQKIIDCTLRSYTQVQNFPAYKKPAADELPNLIIYDGNHASKSFLSVNTKE